MIVCKHIPLIVERKSRKYMIFTGFSYYIFPNKSYIAMIILLDVDKYRTVLFHILESYSKKCKFHTDFIWYRNQAFVDENHQP